MLENMVEFLTNRKCRYLPRMIRIAFAYQSKKTTA